MVWVQKDMSDMLF